MGIVVIWFANIPIAMSFECSFEIYRSLYTVYGDNYASNHGVKLDRTCSTFWSI